MDWNIRNLKRSEVSKLLHGAIVPRPIALVTTLNPDGTVNAAPFSFFNVLCTEPAVLAMISLAPFIVLAVAMGGWIFGREAAQGELHARIASEVGAQVADFVVGLAKNAADAESLSIQPNMEISNRDKVSMFKASDVKLKFPSFRECQNRLKVELPYFARFLLDWKIPEDMVTDETRFGIANFLHPDLFDASVDQGQSGVAAQMVHSFIVADAVAAGGQRNSWKGTSSELYAVISQMNPQFSKEFRTIKGFQTVLGHLKNHSVLRVDSVKRASGHPTTWTIWHPDGLTAGKGGLE